MLYNRCMRKMAFFALLLCLVTVGGTSQEDSQNETVEVSAPVGRVRGSLMKSRLGKNIYSFRGMRYAEAPIGQQRFKQAVPVIPWDDVFDATQEGPSCMHPDGKDQSEDCLRLNVYTTKLPSQNSTDAQMEKRPVIVFFHPGGFYGFSGQSSVIGPEYFMDQDIVLVIMNYRLASLGFLSTGDSLAPGNLGLKDQVESLRWVQKNIASFGGDPNCVTITGYSSGSRSVTLHLVSPMSKGLFHRAIAMSGSAIYQTPLPTDQKHLAKKQAEILGCPTDTTGSMLLCLNTKTAQEIGDSLPKFFEWHGGPIVIWSPVIEPEVPGVERFLTAQPADLIREGKFHKVPIITGITKDEFAGVVVFFTEEVKKGNTSILDDLNENWERIAPILFLYERDTPRSIDISKALKAFYFKGQSISLDNIDALGQIYANGVVGFAVNRFSKLIAEASENPVYYYEFIYQGRYSFRTWSDSKKPYGVVHHDDLLYLFHMGRFPLFEDNSPENSMVERLTSMWAHFAKTGEPIPRDNEKFANVTWTPLTVENNKYLEIGDELIMKINLYSDRMNEWNRLFPLQPLIKTEKH